MTLRQKVLAAIRRYDRAASGRRGLVPLAAFSCALQDVGVPQGSLDADEIFRYCEMAPDGYIWYGALADVVESDSQGAGEISPKHQAPTTRHFGPSAAQVDGGQEFWDMVGPSLRQKFQLWDANTMSNEVFILQVQKLLQPTVILGPDSEFVGLLNRHRFTRSIKYHQVMHALRKDITNARLYIQDEKDLDTCSQVSHDTVKFKIVAAGGAPSSVAPSLRLLENIAGKKHFQSDSDETSSMLSWDSTAIHPSTELRASRRLVSPIPEQRATPPWGDTNTCKSHVQELAVQPSPERRHVPATSPTGEWFNEGTPPPSFLQQRGGHADQTPPDSPNAPYANHVDRAPQQQQHYNRNYSASQQYRHGDGTVSECGSQASMSRDNIDMPAAGHRHPLANGNRSSQYAECRPATAPLQSFDQRSQASMLSVDSEVRFAHKSRMRGGHGDIISWDRQSSRDLTPERDAAASLRRLNDDGRMVIEKMTKKTQLW
eukprot:GEMP01025507.1.p1 GENE.GEMP01025507.1~~GEMP01025507.1.p1  ORF type:complete len:487 (+),score=84.08 GEMP01025507.1:28-1488(+)